MSVQVQVTLSQRHDTGVGTAPAYSLSRTGLDIRQVGLAGWLDGLLQEVGVDGDTLGAVISLVNAHQAVCQLKHVGPVGYRG